MVSAGLAKATACEVGFQSCSQRRICLTFDADVFSTRPTSLHELLPGGKALIQYESRAQHPGGGLPGAAARVNGNRR